MALFSVLVDIAARTAGIDSGVKLVEQKFDHLGEVAKRTGELLGIAFGAEYFKEMILGAVESGDAMAKAAQKAGAAVEEFSALAFAAKQSDVSLESLSKSVKFMQKNIADSTPALRDLGVSMADLKDKSPIEQLELIADRIAGIEDPAQKTKYALALFGRAGTDMIPFLDNGAEGIKRFTDEASRMNITLDQGTAEALKRAKEHANELSASWHKLWEEIAAGTEKFAEFLHIVPSAEISPLQKQLEGITTGIERTSKLIDDLTLKRTRAGAVRLSDEDVAGQRVGRTRATAGQTIDDLRKTLADLQSQKEQVVAQIAAAAEKKSKTILPTIEQPIALHSVNPQTLGEFQQNSAWLQDYARSLTNADTLTKTQTEKILAQWKEFDDALALLQSSGTIDGGEAATRALEYQDSILQPIEVRAKRIKAVVDQANEYELQAARNTQNVIADWITNGFENGFKGIVSSFAKMLAELEAQAAAAKIAEYLFGGTKTENGTTTGILSGLLGGLFDGFKAGGGDVSAGGAYVVGERGPELFMPGTSGSIVPNAALAGGGAVHLSTVNNFYSGTDDVLRRQLPSILDQQQRSTLAQVQEMKRRGTL